MPSIASTALAATPIAAAPTNPDPAAAIAAGRAPASPRSRTRPPHRCGHAARRDGARLRRLRCGRRMGLEDRLRFLRGGDGSVPAQIRPGYARQGRVTRRHAADAGQDRRAFSRRIRAAPRRARRSSNSRRRSRSVSRPAPPPRSRRQTWCWSPRPGRACSPSSPSWQAARSCSTSWRRPVPGC